MNDAGSPGQARRTVLRLAGLAGAGVTVAGCSTAAVPFDASEAGGAPPTAGQPAGTVLGKTTAIPVGGGTVFAAARIVVTQPTKGVFKAFSAICTHVGCLCDQVADGTINCPCHGSRFTITDGAVVTGPARTALPPATITVTDGHVLLA